MGIFKKKDKTEATEEQIAKAKKSKKRKIKAIVICVIVIIYTAIVSFITVKVDRKILSDSLEKSFKEVFSSELTVEDEQGDEASSENMENDKKENSSSKKENLKNNTSKKDDSDMNSSSSDIDEFVIEDSNDDSTFIANDMFMIENICEVEILGADFTKKVTSPSGSPSHNSFESKKAGYQYLDFKMNYENLEKALVNIEQITSVRIIVGGTDYYNSFSLIENEDGNLTYTSATPISSDKVGKLHYLFNVPDSVANGSSRIVAVITIRGNTYEYVIR